MWPQRSPPHRARTCESHAGERAESLTAACPVAVGGPYTATKTHKRLQRWINGLGAHGKRGPKARNPNHGALQALHSIVLHSTTHLGSHAPQFRVAPRVCHRGEHEGPAVHRFPGDVVVPRGAARGVHELAPVRHRGQVTGAPVVLQGAVVLAPRASPLNLLSRGERGGACGARGLVRTF